MMLESQGGGEALLGRPRKPQGKRTLATVLRERGVLSTAHAVEVALQICDALESAHASGVVHGQLGLGTVRLSFTPEGGPREVEIFTLDGREKATAEALVTAAPFVEPERHLGLPVDARADVWALGALLYSLIVGLAPPETGATMPESVPRGLAGVIDSCLARDPSLRPKAVDDVAERIASFSTWPPDHFARLVERRERREVAERARRDLERRGLADVPNVLDKLDDAAVARAQRPTRSRSRGTDDVLERLIAAVNQGTVSSPVLGMMSEVVELDDDDDVQLIPSAPNVPEETQRLEPIHSPLATPFATPLAMHMPLPELRAPRHPVDVPKSAFVIPALAFGAFVICAGGAFVGYAMSARTAARAAPRTAPAVVTPAAPPAAVAAATAGVSASAARAAPLIPVFTPSTLPDPPAVTPGSLPSAKR